MSTVAPGSLTTDVAVVGAGPAGALLAGLLAAGGVDVVLIGPHRHRVVADLHTLAPGAGMLLTDEGVGLGGLIHRLPLQVLWPGSGPASGERGWTTVVDRPGLDRALVAWAALRGARLLDARVVRIDSAVHLVDGAVVSAGETINAAGARSVFAVPRRRTAPRLFGIVSTVDVPYGLGGVWIEAGPEGWSWVASTGTGRASILTAIDGGPPRVEAERQHRQILDITQVKSLFMGPPRDLRPVDLTPTLADVGRFRAVGDAAVTIDPLAGQGLAVALRSAAQLADEMLGGDVRRAMATEVSTTHRDLAASHYDIAGRAFGTAFWTSRAAVIAGHSRWS